MEIINGENVEEYIVYPEVENKSGTVMTEEEFTEQKARVQGIREDVVRELYAQYLISGEEEAFNHFVTNSCQITGLTKEEVLDIVRSKIQEFDFEKRFGIEQSNEKSKGIGR